MLYAKKEPAAGINAVVYRLYIAVHELDPYGAALLSSVHLFIFLFTKA